MYDMKGMMILSKENQRRKIKRATAAAAALLMMGAFSVPSETEIMGVRLGNAVVASAATYGVLHTKTIMTVL